MNTSNVVRTTGRGPHVNVGEISLWSNICVGKAKAEIVKMTKGRAHCNRLSFKVNDQNERQNQVRPKATDYREDNTHESTLPRGQGGLVT